MYRPIVMVPGLRCDGYLYQPVIDRLDGGIAPIIGTVSMDDSIAGMARRILAAAPPAFALAGLSMGGYVALEIMRQAPERVTHLALLDTNARPDSDERKQARHAEMALVAQGKAALVSRTALPGLLAARHLGTPIAEAVHAMAMRVTDETYARQQRAIMDRIDSRPLLRHIAVPTLVGVGAEDKLIPLPLSEEMAEAIPGAELVIFPQAGHVPTLENPDAVAAALRRWLDR